MLYSPERAQKIAEEATKGDSVFSVDDRMGLVHDSTALAKAGYVKTSSVLDLAEMMSKNEKECKFMTHHPSVIL